MAADRERLQEVQADERALWDKERDALKMRIIEQEDRIAELETLLERGGVGSRVMSGSARSASPAAGMSLFEPELGHYCATLHLLTVLFT